MRNSKRSQGLQAAIDAGGLEERREAYLLEGFLRGIPRIDGRRADPFEILRISCNKGQIVRQRGRANQRINRGQRPPGA